MSHIMVRQEETIYDRLILFSWYNNFYFLIDIFFILISNIRSVKWFNLPSQEESLQLLAVRKYITGLKEKRTGCCHYQLHRQLTSR